MMISGGGRRTKIVFYAERRKEENNIFLNAGHHWKQRLFSRSGVGEMKSDQMVEEEFIVLSCNTILVPNLISQRRSGGLTS